MGFGSVGVELVDLLVQLIDIVLNLFVVGFLKLSPCLRLNRTEVAAFHIADNA